MNLHFIIAKLQLKRNGMHLDTIAIYLLTEYGVKIDWGIINFVLGWLGDGLRLLIAMSDEIKIFTQWIFLVPSLRKYKKCP
jgi:hypothetical protein